MNVTMPKRDKDLLDKISEEDDGGNRSMTIRRAVKVLDKIRKLEGKELFYKDENGNEVRLDFVI
jgi:metal-responsive CopG/Arc/MetJ family transcriptional regulator|tara:strand:- start:123 stop:314 length:192 start_codon:yes stop_codon:yes gene_type:complete